MRGPKKYIITSAQAESSPNVDFLRSLDRYCFEKDSKIIILPMAGRDGSQGWENLDQKLSGFDIEYGTRRLNDNVSIDQFNVRPQMIDPITGLNRFTQRETTKVFASPKQRLKGIPHSNKKHPKFLVTTGAVTLPNYATGDDVSMERRRLGQIALRDHVYGALVVEVLDNNTFFMRHIRSNQHGEFVDLGARYTKEGPKSAGVEALVLGDYHVGRGIKEVYQATDEMITELRPKKIVLHDFFDGHSVSHHIEKGFIDQNIIQRLDAKQDNLEKELKDCYNHLMKLHRISNGAEIVLVHSNHHDFLHRYLNEGRFMKDPQNARIAFKLASYFAEADYNNPVERGIRMQGDLPKNVRFLKVDDDYKVQGYQLACHGHLGANGGYGSIVGKENDMGKSVSGHVHTAETLRNTHTVGTCIDIHPYYARGQPTRATNSHGVIYDNGSFQHLVIIDGKWKL